MNIDVMLSSVKFRRMTRFVSASLVFLLTGLALAASPSAGKHGDSALAERVQSYWTARALRDWHTLYAMESEALPRGKLTPAETRYVQGLPVRKPKITGIEIGKGVAAIKVSAEVNVGSLGWMPQQVSDSWVLIDGVWYHKTYVPGKRRNVQDIGKPSQPEPNGDAEK